MNNNRNTITNESEFINAKQNEIMSSSERRNKKLHDEYMKKLEESKRKSGS